MRTTLHEARPQTRPFQFISTNCLSDVHQPSERGYHAGMSLEACPAFAESAARLSQHSDVEDVGSVACEASASPLFVCQIDLALDVCISNDAASHLYTCSFRRA